MHYQKNRLRARTRNTEPTLTEQSGANDTDINVIVGKFRVTGRVPGAQGQPLAGDFTEMPGDLRGFIEMARSTRDLKRKLPKELRNKSDAELLALTQEQLTNILTPPATPPAEERSKTP